MHFSNFVNFRVSISHSFALYLLFAQMQSQKQQPVLYEVTIRPKTTLQQLFPNFHAPTTLLIQKLSFQLFLKKTVIQQQLKINQFVTAVANANPKANALFVQYSVIDVTYKKKTGHVFVAAFQKDGYIAGVQTLINEYFPKIWAQSWEKMEEWVGQLWAHLQACLNEVIAYFSKGERLNEVPLTFCLTRADNRNVFKAMIKHDVQNRAKISQQQLLLVYQLQFQDQIFRATAKIKSSKKQENLSKIETVLQKVFASSQAPDFNFDFTAKFGECEPVQILGELQSILLLSTLYQIHFKHMVQYITYSEECFESNIQNLQVLDWIGLNILNISEGTFMMELNKGVPCSQRLLKEWPITGQENLIMYSHRYQLLKYTNSLKFYNYIHFELTIKKMRNFKIRKQNQAFLTKTQRFRLNFTLNQLEFIVHCPVRGKYCRHLQFYDLKKVYLACHKKATEEGQKSWELVDGFECFVCEEWIDFDNLLYLEEVKILIEVLFNYRLMIEDGCKRENWQIQIEINHQLQSVKLNTTLKDFMSNSFEVKNAYQTLVDPLNKYRVPFNEKKYWQFEDRSDEHAQFLQILENGKIILIKTQEKDLNFIEDPTCK